MAVFKARDRSDDGRTREKWSISAMPVDTRERAVAAAQDRRMLVSELVEQAILAFLDGADASPPSPPEPPDDSPPPGDQLSELERIAAVMVGLSEGTKKPVPIKDAARVRRALLALLPPEGPSRIVRRKAD